MIIKKIFLAAFSLVLCLSLHAQLEQGKYTIGLGLDIDPQFQNFGVGFSLDETTFEIGYFVKDKWEVGASGNYQFGRNMLFKRTDYNFGVYTKYYFLDTKKFTPYFGAFAGAGRVVSISDSSGALNFNRLYLKAAAGVGTDYWVTKKFAITGGVRYSINEFFENAGIDFNKIEIRGGAKYNF